MRNAQNQCLDFYFAISKTRLANAWVTVLFAERTVTELALPSSPLASAHKALLAGRSNAEKLPTTTG